MFSINSIASEMTAKHGSAQFCATVDDVLAIGPTADSIERRFITIVVQRFTGETYENE